MNTLQISLWTKQKAMQPPRVLYFLIIKKSQQFLFQLILSGSPIFLPFSMEWRATLVNFSDTQVKSFLMFTGMEIYQLHLSCALTRLICEQSTFCQLLVLLRLNWEEHEIVWCYTLTEEIRLVFNWGFCLIPPIHPFFTCYTLSVSE